MSEGLPIAPMRLCCFQRHYGVVCPDGKVMCCICFGRFEQSDLNVTDDGSREDVCIACAAHESLAAGSSGEAPQP